MQSSKLTLNMSKEDLEWATQEGLITQAQAEKLWNALVKQHTERSQLPQFDLTHLFWYAGTVLVFLAIGWFCTEMGLYYGPSAVFVTSTAYLLSFLLGGSYLWFKKICRSQADYSSAYRLFWCLSLSARLPIVLAIPLTIISPMKFF